MRDAPLLRRLSAALALAGALGCGSAAAQQPLQIRFGHNIAVGTPTDLGAKRFAELVEQRSGGKIKVLVYPGGQLGNEQQMIEGLQIGTLDMASIVGATYGNTVPVANVLGLLYAFRDVDHMRAAMRGAPGQMIADAMLKTSSTHLVDASWYYGTRELTSNRPVKTPDDLKGLKLRIVPVPVFKAAWSAEGATPTPIDFKELFTALQNNTVDGQENPLPIIDSVGIPLVNKYLTLTDHVVANEIVAMSDDLYQRLTPEQRALVTQAVKDAGDYKTKLVLDSEAKLLDKFKAQGMTIITPDKAPFRAKVAEVAKTFNNGSLAEISAKIEAVP